MRPEWCVDTRNFCLYRCRKLTEPTVITLSETKKQYGEPGEWLLETPDGEPRQLVDHEMFNRWWVTYEERPTRESLIELYERSRREHSTKLLKNALFAALSLLDAEPAPEEPSPVEAEDLVERFGARAAIDKILDHVL